MTNGNMVGHFLLRDCLLGDVVRFFFNHGQDHQTTTRESIFGSCSKHLRQSKAWMVTPDFSGGEGYLDGGFTFD